MPDPIRLHLDADASRKALHRALLDRGHDVTRTPCDWMELDADDAIQLLRAGARGRVLFTFNIGDFMALHEENPGHRGILLAAQASWSLSSLVHSLDHFLSKAEAGEMEGRIAWLNRWKEK